MVDLKPIYTTDNCRFSAPLMWSQTVFWREPEPDDGWLEQLSVDLEPDGIRLLSHDYVCGQSQFAISTAAHVAPSKIVQRVKGRLYHLVRKRKPQPFKGNYAIRSVGKVTRQTIEGYVSGQLVHHVMADPIVQSRMAKYQIECREIDLSEMQKTSHGGYWYNLHLVFTHRERWAEIRHEVLSELKAMVLAIARKKNLRLSRAALLSDHLHVVLGCAIDIAPDEVAMAFLNNLAFVHKMKPIYEFGGFVGTIGEYTNHAF